MPLVVTKSDAPVGDKDPDSQHVIEKVEVSAAA